MDNKKSIGHIPVTKNNMDSDTEKMKIRTTVQTTIKILDNVAEIRENFF